MYHEPHPVKGKKGQTRRAEGQWQLHIGQVKIPSPSGVPPVKAAHSGDCNRNNNLCPICAPQDKTGPTSFVYHLFTTPVSIVLWGQGPFKWQMGGTSCEHVMWVPPGAQTTLRHNQIHWSGIHQHRTVITEHQNHHGWSGLRWGRKSCLCYRLTSQERSRFQ